MRIRQIISLLTVASMLTFAASCSSNEVRHTLDDVEPYIQERPDSALVVLNEVKDRFGTKNSGGAFSLRPSRRLQARYALLYSYAQYKGDVIEKNDSLIRTAVDYYSSHKSPNYSMMSCFVLGTVQYNAGDYSGAVASLRKAETEALALGDDHQLGLIYRYIGDSYIAEYDSLHALEYYIKSGEAFEREGNGYYARYSELSASRSMSGLRRYDDAKELLSKVIERADGDSLVLAESYRILANIARLQSDYSLSNELYFKASGYGKVYYTMSDWCNMALNYYSFSKEDLADYYLSIAESRVRTMEDSARVYDVRYLIEKRRGRLLQALDAQENAVRLQNRIVRKQLDQSISYSESERLRQEEALQHKIVENKRTEIIALILLAALVILFLVFIIARMQWYLREQLYEIQYSKTLLVELEKEMKGKNIRIADLLKARFSLLESVVDKYNSIELNGDENALSIAEKYDYIEKYRAELRSIRKDDSYLCDLEQSLNSWKDGIMIKCREVLPDEDELSMKVLMLLFAEVPMKTISFLTDMDYNAVKMRKSRYKSKIEQSNSPYRDCLLENLH